MDRDDSGVPPFGPARSTCRGLTSRTRPPSGFHLSSFNRKITRLTRRLIAAVWGGLALPPPRPIPGAVACAVTWPTAITEVHIGMNTLSTTALPTGHNSGCQILEAHIVRRPSIVTKWRAQ